MDIGSPVEATDADGDDLTYSLDGTDAASFGIDAGTGQLKTSAPLGLRDEDQLLHHGEGDRRQHGLGHHRGDDQRHRRA